MSVSLARSQKGLGIHQELSHKVRSPKQKAIVHTIIQLAVRIFFVFSVIVMSAALLPLAFQAVLLPLFAIGAAVLASFFFQLEPSVFAQRIEAMPPLLKYIEKKPIRFAIHMPDHMPKTAPRGIFRLGNNCWLNSLLQWIESDPLVARWIRIPIPPEMEPFIQYMQQYELPDGLVNGFRNYIQNHPLPVQAAFSQFLAGYVPNAGFEEELRKFRDEIYPNLLILQPTFSQFFEIYDHARRDNLALVNANSQYLRLVLNRISQLINPSPAVQLDAAEAAGVILDLLPNSLKLQLEEENHYRVAGVTPIAGHPDGITRKTIRDWGIALSIDPKDQHPELGRMFKHFCNEKLRIPNRSDWITHINENQIDQKYQPIRRKFHLLEFPRSLRFQIKRMESIRSTNWLAKVLPRRLKHREKIVKITKDVSIPDVLPVQKNSGEIRNYQLAAVTVHEGESTQSGHYETFRKIEDGKVTYYRLDDHVVTQIDRQEWERAVRQAYLVQYSPV